VAGVRAVVLRETKAVLPWDARATGEPRRPEPSGMPFPGGPTELPRRPEAIADRPEVIPIGREFIPELPE
jgi:hypothetical protein